MAAAIPFAATMERTAHTEHDEMTMKHNNAKAVRMSHLLRLD
jgi:hypothetical protein